MKFAKKYEKESKVHMFIAVIWRKVTLNLENVFNVKGAHMKESRIHELYRKVARYVNNLFK